MKALGILLLVVLAQVQMSLGQGLARAGFAAPDPAQEQAVDELVARQPVAPLAIVLVHNHRMVWARQWGSKGGLPVDSHTVFATASLTKPVFAYLVLRLVDAKVLRLDAPLATYLPPRALHASGYRALAKSSHWRRLTVRMVLSHTSGLPNFRGSQLRFVRAPGSRFGYSGEAMNLLQAAVEEATGSPLSRLADSLVFKPLGMTRSSMSHAPELAAQPDLHRDFDAELDESEPTGRARAAGSMYTSAHDYATFLIAAMKGTGLSRAMRWAMFHPQVRIRNARMYGPLQARNDEAQAQQWSLAWGLGFGLYQGRYGTAAMHIGHYKEVQNLLIAYPKQGDAVVILSSSPNMEQMAPELIELLANDTAPWRWLNYPQPLVSERRNGRN